MDLRKIGIIFVIAVLYAVLVQSTIEAVYPSPEWEDYCAGEGRPVPKIERINDAGKCEQITIPGSARESCSAQKGYISYRYDEQGCEAEYYCETCQQEYEEARETYNFIVFIISSVLGVLAVAIGLYLPKKKDPIHEWVGAGLLLGGLITIFIGTIRSFGDLHRIIRPIIILIELLLVIFITYIKFGAKKALSKKR